METSINLLINDSWTLYGNSSLLCRKMLAAKVNMLRLHTVQGYVLLNGVFCHRLQAPFTSSTVGSAIPHVTMYEL